MVHVLSTLIARAHHNLFVVVQVALGYALYLLTHGGREEQRITVFGNTLQNRIDALCKAHVQHLIGLIQHHVIYVIQLRYATVHQVNQSSGCCYDNLHTLAQCTNLLLDRRTTINGLDMDVVHIFREVAQVVGNLQAQLSSRRQDECLRLLSCHINTLQYGNTKCRRLTCTRLGQCNHVVLIS